MILNINICTTDYGLYIYVCVCVINGLVHYPYASILCLCLTLYSCILYSTDIWQGKTLMNGTYTKFWQAKVWQMDCRFHGRNIKTEWLVEKLWLITGHSSNSSNFVLLFNSYLATYITYTTIIHIELNFLLLVFTHARWIL